MPYIGPEPRSGRFAIVDQISGSFNGVNTDFRIRVAGQNTAPGMASNMLVYLNGSGQTPSGNLTYNAGSFDFSVDGSILTFETAPQAGTTFYAEILGPVLGIGQPSDGTVVPGSITSLGVDFIFPSGITASGDISAQQIEGTVISGSTRVASTFVSGVSGEFDRLDVDTLDIDKINIKTLTVTGDLFVSGNYFSQTGDLHLQEGSLLASGGTITGFNAVTINTQSLESTENISSDTLVTAPSGRFTTNISGNFIQSATTVTGGQLVTAPTGIFTNISGDELTIKDLTVTGKLNVTGVNISGIIAGNLHVSGIFANSGVISGTLSGQTITGDRVQATTGTFEVIEVVSLSPTTITAETGIFTSRVSGATGVFDDLTFNGTVQSKSGVFTEFLSGLTITGQGLNVPNITGDFFNANDIQVERLRLQTFISGNPLSDPVTVTGSTGIEVTTSGVIIYGPVTILP